MKKPLISKDILLISILSVLVFFTWVNANSITEYALKIYTEYNWTAVSAVTATASIDQKKWNLVATNIDTWKLPSDIFSSNIWVLASLSCNAW